MENKKRREDMSLEELLRETERYLNKHGAGKSNSGRIDEGR